MTCPYCKGEAQEVYRGTPENIRFVGPCRTYKCTLKQCGAVWFEIEQTGPITEADVFGDLSDFKNSNPLPEGYDPNRQDEGTTLCQQIDKITPPKIEANRLLQELRDRLIFLRNQTTDAAGRDYIENLVFLAAKARHLFDNQALPAEAVMRHLLH